MFYCIFIEKRSDKDLDIAGIVEYSKNAGFFLVRPDANSCGLGRRL
jgi:hypothetical protein